MQGPSDPCIIPLPAAELDAARLHLASLKLLDELVQRMMQLGIRKDLFYIFHEQMKNIVHFLIAYIALFIRGEIW